MDRDQSFVCVYICMCKFIYINLYIYIILACLHSTYIVLKILKLLQEIKIKINYQYKNNRITNRNEKEYNKRT